MDRIAEEAERAIVASLSRRRTRSADMRDRRVAAIRGRHPELEKIEIELSVAGVELLMEAMNPGGPDPRERLKRLNIRRQEILDEIGLDSDYDKVRPFCASCGDTGLLPSDEPCACREPLRRQYLLEASRLGALENARFSSFDLSCFDDQINDERYRADVSPRDQIKGISNVCFRFARNLKDTTVKDLLLTGMPGTGKSFMAACVANEAIESGSSVQYFTAPGMFDRLSSYRALTSSFRPDEERLEEAMRDHDAILDCRLLIIDDLGTEPLKATTLPELLRILDHRYDSGLRTLFCTNAEPAALREMYDERLWSRMIGRCTLLRFFGADLRLQSTRKRLTLSGDKSDSLSGAGK